MTAIDHSVIASASTSLFQQLISNQAPFTYRHDGPEGIEGRFRILPVGHTRALQTGLDLLANRPMALLGISLGNPYFTRKRIEITICAMASFFDQVTIVIPDSVAMHTYRALGYDEHTIRAKTKAEGQKIKNRCLRAIERARQTNPLAELKILDWERDITSLPGYWDAYDRVCRLFNTHERFRNDVLDKGYSVLAKKLPQETIAPAAVRECIEYLLKEFAYLMICRQASGRDLVIPYNLDFALGQGFCDGEYQEPLPGIGCLIFDIELMGEANPLDIEPAETRLIPA